MKVSKSIITINKTTFYKDNLYQLNKRCGGNYLNTLIRDYATCQICESVLRIVVHHKDGNNKNNKLENLICLCKNCHGDCHDFLRNIKKIPMSIIKKMKNQGKTFVEIGKKFGVSRQRIHQIFKKLNTP